MPARAVRAARSRWRAWVIGAVVIVAALAAIRLAPIGRGLLPSNLVATPSDAGSDGRSDPRILTVSLHGLVVADDPSPHILRALAPDGRVEGGEMLMLRVRLSRPAFLTLLSQKPPGAAEPIWPANSEQHAQGEFELEEGDHPLLLNPNLFGNGVHLALVACDARLAGPALRTAESLSDGAVVTRLFPGCAVDELTVFLAPPRERPSATK